MNKLFVYGIFLGEGSRDRYLMSNPQYATVKGYKTVSASHRGDIVKAVATGDNNDVLTGLVVDVEPGAIWHYGALNNWERLDALEGAYNRIEIRTTDDTACWMYVAR